MALLKILSFLQACMLSLSLFMKSDSFSHKTPTDSCLLTDTLAFLPLVSTCPHVLPQQPFLRKFVLVSMQANGKLLITTIREFKEAACILYAVHLAKAQRRNLVIQ